jgi:hypothetical protein
MIFIPAQLIALLSFPGVIVYEITHKFFCDLMGVRVYKVCYFRYDNPYSYTIHEPITNLGAALLIAIGPFLVGTTLCIILSFPASILTQTLQTPMDSRNLTLLFWISVSIGMHSFPSNQAIAEFQETIQNANAKLHIYIIAKIFNLFLKLISALRAIWIDLIYAVFITGVLPNLLIGFI